MCDTPEERIVFKALYLFTLFCFQRMSNLLAHKVKQFDVTKHLARGDLLFSEQYCTVIIKWSKTL